MQRRCNQGFENCNSLHGKVSGNAAIDESCRANARRGCTSVTEIILSKEGENSSCVGIDKELKFSPPLGFDFISEWGKILFLCDCYKDCHTGGNTILCVLLDTLIWGWRGNATSAPHQQIVSFKTVKYFIQNVRLYRLKYGTVSSIFKLMNFLVT